MISPERLRELCDGLRALGEETGTVFFVLAVERTGPTRQWAASAAGPWPHELRNAADEFERGFPADCNLDDPQAPAGGAFEQN